jgi:predicted enzyme related to lactoylglutathione lyase
MKACAQVPALACHYYIAVESIAQAADRARTRGAQFLHGPAENPGGAWIVQVKKGNTKRKDGVSGAASWRVE